MKKNIYRWILMAFSVLLAGGIYSACEDADEIPPRTDTSQSSKEYKMPETVVLNDIETAEYNAIKKEYETNVVQ